MKLVLVHKLQPGMVIAKDIYGGNHMLLAPVGAVVTKRTISTLLLHSIISIYIREDAAITTSLSLNNPVPSLHTRFLHFEKVFKRTTDCLQNQINDVVTKNSPIRPDELFSQTSSLFTEDMTTISLFDMLHHMRDYDDSTFVHSVNVALICNVFGKWLNLKQSDLEVLTLSGLLHDIGKVSIPDSIIKKPGRLTKDEYNVIKRHPFKGYEILKSHTELDPRIAQAALMHHERCDGSGYPTGCYRRTIPDAAQIVAIADVYDAMTSKRVYRDALSPFKVIRILEQEGMQKYDPYYILTFLEHIINTYVNTDVLLSDGQKAHVIFINKDHLSRPVVKVGNNILDLSKQRGLEIEAMV